MNAHSSANTMMQAGERAELTDLVNRYARNADRLDFDGLARLFTEDAVLAVPVLPESLTPSVEVRGRAAIVDNCRQLESLIATQHAIVGCTFDSTAANEATGEVSCIAHHVEERRGKAVDHVWHLHYRDRYRRLDGSWLIDRRELWLDWIEQQQVSVHRRRHAEQQTTSESAHTRGKEDS